MKRTLTVLLSVAIVAVAVLFAFVRKAPERHLVEMSFLEFTNAPDGPYARLAIHFAPRFAGCRWGNSSPTSRKVNGVWEPWSPEPGTRKGQRFMDNPYPPPVGRDGRPINCVMMLPVENTNDVWRFVIEVSEAPAGPPRFVLVARNWWWHLVNNRNPQLGRIDKYNTHTITNETSRIGI